MTSLDSARLDVRHRGAGGPCLSIVILSAGPTSRLEHAVTLLSDTAFSLEAQLVIVRESADAEDREEVQRLAQRHGCVCAFSEPGGGRGAMSDQAMRVATGDIVALREDVEVGEGEWLSAFQRRERVVADAERSLVTQEERPRGAVRSLADRPTKGFAPTVKRRVEPVSQVPG